jgi:C-terminal peptidase prc
MGKALMMTLGGLLAALALAGPASAEDAAPAATPKTYAILIGISKYGDDQIKPRPHAEADVKALYDLIVNKKHFGASPDNVKLLLGSGTGKEQATRANILAALKWLTEHAGADDLVLFTFVGEGGPLGESGDRLCYFASDSTFKDRSKDAVAASEISDALKGLKSKRFCTFLDVNFKGFTETGGATAITEPTLGKAPYKEFLGDDGTEDHAPLPGRVLFLATNGLSASMDLKDHGLFTEALLAGLSGAADNDSHDGYEADGLITVDELTKFLDKKISELCRANGKTEKEKQAPHYVLGGRQSHYVLCENPDAIGPARKRLEKFEALLKDKGGAKFAEEGKALLEQMPRLKGRQELRKAYQSLADGKTSLEEFETSRDKILTGMKMPRVEAVAYAKKVMEVAQIIRDDYVKVVNEGEMVGWAIRGLYRQIEEKIPDAIEAKLKDVKEMREGPLAVLLADARQALGNREDLAKEKDLNISLVRMLHKLDPYTTYIDPETLARFKIDVSGHFTGIGIQIRKDATTDQLLVVTPIKGSPAYKAGLLAGDLITTVHTLKYDEEGNPKEGGPVTVPTKGMQLSDAVKLILGPKGTPVTLTVQREGTEKPFEVVMKRGTIEVESVLGIKRKTDDDWDYMIDPKNKIGYIRLTNFAEKSYADLKEVMDDLVKQGIKGFILDLRFNPGGLLTSAIEISDLYIDDGMIVKIKPRTKREQKFNGRHEGSLLDFPMVCLVNGYSASGSEIVSAALQDHNRALIIGERSYGKGSVQNIVKFGKGEVKLTTASFWRPSGKNLNKSSTGGKEEDEWGVTPDKIVKLSAKERDDLAEHQHQLEIIERPDKRGKAPKNEFKDRQLETALEYLRGQIKMAARVPTSKES